MSNSIAAQVNESVQSIAQEELSYKEQAAVRYAQNGWPVIALYGTTKGVCDCSQGPACSSSGKHPRLTGWQDDDNLADVERVRQHWTQFTNDNVALRQDEFLVLDIDVKPGVDGYASLAALEEQYGPVERFRADASTGGGGRHFLYRRVGVPPEFTQSISKLGKGVDVLSGSSRFLIVEPSVTCGPYAWQGEINPLKFHRNEIPLSDCPRWLFQEKGERVKLPRFKPAADGSVVEGMRHAYLISWAGWFWNENADAGYDEVLEALKEENKRVCSPPSPFEELRKLAQWISKKKHGFAQGSGKRRTQGEILEALNSDIECVQGSDGGNYIRLPVGDHLEAWPLDSERARNLLEGKFHSKTGKAPSREALTAEMNRLRVLCFKSVPQMVYTRVARCIDRVYLDLGDAAWRVVEILPGSWNVLESTQSPVLFRRPKDTLPLPMPVSGGSVEGLHPFLNMSGGQFKMAVSWLLSFFQPSGPAPLLALGGGQGTGKTAASLCLQRLIDPRVGGLADPPKTIMDLALRARNCGVVAMDNLSWLSPEMSDALCRVVSGSGIRCRELYTNGEEYVFEGQAPVLLNGIDDNLISRSDLQSRAIVLELKAIEKDKRRPSSDMEQEFKAAHGRILGALLDTVAAGLVRLPSTPREGLPRMADFCCWITACEQALGWRSGEFARLYETNSLIVSRDSVYADELGVVLAELALQQKCSHAVVYRAGELLERLNSMRGESFNRHTWPQSGPALGKKLKRMIVPFSAIGVELSAKREAAGIRWSIKRLSPQIVLPLEQTDEDLAVAS